MDWPSKLRKSGEKSRGTATQTLPVLRFGFSGLRLVRLKACDISVLKEVLELEICR